MQADPDAVCRLAPDDCIEEIVERNIRSGRMQRVCRFSGGQLTREEYAGQVALHYVRYQDRVSRLACNESAAWEDLWRQLFRSAYGLLLRSGWEAEQAYVRAEEAAQETCLSIYCRTYPYDCPFDAWALTILRHHVFRSYHRSKDPLDALGRTYPLEESSAEEPPPISYQVEIYEPLIDAISQMPSIPQREVIFSLFFRGLTVEETARRLGKTPQAIYNLKGRALAKLSDLLAEDHAL